MLDTLSILASCAGCLYVAWRARKLDKTRPWFPPVPRAGGGPERSPLAAARGR